MSAEQWRVVEAVLKILAGLAAVATITGVVIAIQRWRWERRPDVLDWEIDDHYEIDPDRDGPKYPGLFRQENPARGQIGIHIRATFHGRHELKITGLAFNWNFSTERRVSIQPITLQDTQSWECLIFTQMVAMDQVTSVTIEAEGGRRFRNEINHDYQHRWKSHTGVELP